MKKFIIGLLCALFFTGIACGKMVIWDIVGHGSTYGGDDRSYPHDDVYFEMLTSDSDYIQQQGCDTEWMVILSAQPTGEYGRSLIFVCGDPLNFHGGRVHYVGMHLYKDQFDGYKIVE